MNPSQIDEVAVQTCSGYFRDPNEIFDSITCWSIDHDRRFRFAKWTSVRVVESINEIIRMRIENIIIFDIQFLVQEEGKEAIMRMRMRMRRKCIFEFHSLCTMTTVGELTIM
jgi:hypothetical protein